MMTVSREILMHPDFMTNLADELCEMLEALIDAEFEKGDDTDFDFIDECADAINAIRSGDTAQVIPLVSRKDFLKKIGFKTERKFKILVAAAAVVLVFAASTQIEFKEGYTISHALSGIISEWFEKERIVNITTTSAPPETTQPEETTVETTTEPVATESPINLIDIRIEKTADFKTEYYVGEEFSKKGLKVFAEYDNGKRKLMGINDFTVEIPDDFATQPKYETIIISAEGFTKTIEVRIIESIETKKLNSVYALFPEDFDFTAEDLYGIDLSEMQVYAVYSNGSEKELTEDEYSVNCEYEKTPFDESVTITVSYENCSCSFMIFKE